MILFHVSNVRKKVLDVNEEWLIRERISIFETIGEKDFSIHRINVDKLDLLLCIDHIPQVKDLMIQREVAFKLFIGDLLNGLLLQPFRNRFFMLGKLEMGIVGKNRFLGIVK
jgi:hypothetical protein